MRNAADAAALSSPAWRGRAAAAVARAVERFVTAR
jgi:N-acetylmuramoyl-L-alanine amidase